ncbi:MAG TPA: hypothetical protein VEY94_10995 [Patescibacteria group bacterium]|nr:hypothetical protein [Patescibacteria group bacterium]
MARRRECLSIEVLRGHHRPPRYCQQTHSTAIMSGTAHGIAGVVERLAAISADQMP